MRVAIWGSCATRDAFEVREHSFESIDYFARSSWIAQASAPPAIRLDTSALSGFAQRMVLEDVDRLIVERLVDSNPDLVVIDFIDERMDLLDAGVGAWVTGSTYAGQTPTWAQLRASGVPALGRYHPFREPLFRAAVDQIAPRLLALPPQVPVMLNLAWYTPISCDEAVELPEGSAAKAVEANRQIARLATWVAQALGDRCVYFQATELTMRADPAHKWGLDMFHYETPLYDDLIDAMEATASGERHPLVAPCPHQFVPPAFIEQLAEQEQAKVREAQCQAVTAAVPAVTSPGLLPTSITSTVGGWIPNSIKPRVRDLYRSFSRTKNR